MANFNAMKTLRIQCQHCRKAFSGDERKIAAIKACPKCKTEGLWWEKLNGPSVPASTASPAQAPNDARLPINGPTKSNAPSADSTPYGEAALTSSVPRPSVLKFLIPVAIVIVLGVTATGIWWLASGDNSSDSGSASDLTEEQRHAIDELVKELNALNSRLDVGVSYNDYVGYLGDIKVKLDAAENACGENAPLSLTILGRAFQDHKYAKMVWGESIKNGRGEWVPAMFHSNLETSYGITKQFDRIWLTDALSAVWKKSADRVQDAESYLEK